MLRKVGQYEEQYVTRHPGCTDRQVLWDIVLASPVNGVYIADEGGAGGKELSEFGC